MEQDLRVLLKILDALSCYAILFERSGAIRTANRKFLDTIGRRKEETAGLPLEILESHLPGIKDQFSELPNQGFTTFHARLMDQRGKALFIEMTLVHVEEQGQELVAGIGHALHKLTSGQETALRRTEQQLMAANRLKRKFIANINHAIRTPMNAIIGYAEMLAESDLDEQQQRFVGTIRKNGTALVSIINDVMELSKLETGNVKVLKSNVNLQVLAEQAADLFAEQIRAKKLAFECVIDPKLPRMYVMDADHCRQVLINLISNSVKFTERGKITLAVSGTESEPGSFSLAFQLKDSGVGMSAEEQEVLRRLFAEDEHSISIHDGTSLGLTLCARLARVMGGSIFMESVKGQGSTFLFTMPAKTVEQQQGRHTALALPEHQEEAAGRKQRSPTILVVDDMPEMSGLIKIYFTNTPIRVLEAASLEECLQLAVAEQPDLVLMDLDLAGTDGRDAARLLKENAKTARIPVAVMTGLLLEQDSLPPLFDDFLAKPFHLQELQRLVDKYVPLPKNKAPAPPRSKEDFPAADLAPIRAAWNKDLEAAYLRAQMSGSLDDALALGRKMQEQGRQTEVVELAAMGKQMKKFAADLDIRGVEHILTVLRRVAGKGK